MKAPKITAKTFEQQDLLDCGISVMKLPKRLWIAVFWEDGAIGAYESKKALVADVRDYITYKNSF